MKKIDPVKFNQCEHSHTRTPYWKIKNIKILKAIEKDLIDIVAHRNSNNKDKFAARFLALQTGYQKSYINTVTRRMVSAGMLIKLPPGPNKISRFNLPAYWEPSPELQAQRSIIQRTPAQSESQVSDQERTQVSSLGADASVQSRSGQYITTSITTPYNTGELSQTSIRLAQSECRLEGLPETEKNILAILNRHKRAHGLAKILDSFASRISAGSVEMLRAAYIGDGSTGPVFRDALPEHLKKLLSQHFKTTEFRSEVAV